MLGKQKWIIRLVGASPCIVPDRVHVEYQSSVCLAALIGRGLWGRGFAGACVIAAPLLGDGMWAV